MEESEMCVGRSISMSHGFDGGEGYDLNSGVFFELKQYCIPLLEIIRNPRNDHSFLPQFLALIRRSPPRSLEPFLDYILFPLFLVFDEAVSCRSSKVLSSQTKPPHNVTDSVAEGVVLCLEVVLRKCLLGSLDQMIIVLKKLALGAMLSSAEASEEFREGVIRCFSALLLNLSHCSDESCSCKEISGWPLLASEEFPRNPVTRVLISSECLLAFLQSEAASPAIGHWLSLLLKAADNESARGHRGSSKLRVEALMAFRVLVAKVGSPDALAFFLPGVVSQLGKVLHTSRSMISGAAGSSDALNQTVRGLSEYLIIVIGDVASRSLHMSRIEKPSVSLLEELRQLAVKIPVEASNSTESADSYVGNTDTASSSSKVLRVNRTVSWLEIATGHVNKLFSATFPYLCVHPNRKVRLGLLASVKALVDMCCYSLKQSRLMLLEWLCVLVCDDSEDVSSDAQEFFRFLMSSKEKQDLEQDISEIFSSLVEKLPQVIMRDDDASALSHARKLLTVTFYGGSRLVSKHLLQSPVASTRFLDSFTVCLSPNSSFAGSLNKIVAIRPSSAGFMHSIHEINAIANISDETSRLVNRSSYQSDNNIKKSGRLPGIPPWFIHVGSPKLYDTLARILRLVSLYIFTDPRGEGYFPVVMDILLEPLRKLISELRIKQYKDESWQFWYERTGSGNLVRQAGTAVCILNEMVYGLSDPSVVNSFSRDLSSPKHRDDDKSLGDGNLFSGLKHRKTEAKTQMIDCIGTILHEYLSPEIWELPLGITSSVQQSSGGGGDISMHFFNDNGMLHQVIIEGIGVFNICLDKEFSSCGFLSSSLYLLLENVICSNFHVRTAADNVLHVISGLQNCPTVGHLVLENADYVVDSICRQLRSLDLNPHVPNVLGAMLSYIGVADKILPLLEEPMNSVSVELEILGRQRRPNLTLPFLTAVAEICKASKYEAKELPGQAELFRNEIRSKTSRPESTLGEERSATGVADMTEEEWESTVFTLNDSKRYRRIVGSIAGSCIATATPLIASDNPAECSTALDVIDDGILVLSQVEKAYRYETEAKETVIEALESLSFHRLVDGLKNVCEDEASENRLLPAMNKIWPFLINCFRTDNLLSIKKCCRTISTAVRTCGGDFFVRRFLTDGGHIWSFLTASPYRKKKHHSRIPLRLPYRKAPVSDDPPSETSALNVQAAILEMIADLSGDRTSSKALEAVFKKVCGMTVGIACSGGAKRLHPACENALLGLASMDSDTVWLLLCDVYYSRKGFPEKEEPPPPEGFPEIGRLLPPAKSSKEYLHVVYGGQNFGFHDDVDFDAVEKVLRTLHHHHLFSNQTMYF